MLVRKNRGVVIGEPSFPTSEEQLPRSVYIINHMRRMGTLHVKIGPFLLEKIGEAALRRSQNNFSLRLRLRRRKFSRYIAHKILKMRLDLFLMDLCHNSQCDRLCFRSDDGL